MSPPLPEKVVVVVVVVVVVGESPLFLDRLVPSTLWRMRRETSKVEFSGGSGGGVGGGGWKQ